MSKTITAGPQGVRTVKASWTAFAVEHGVEPRVIIEAKLSEHFHGLSNRLQKLATEVLLRLPEDWDSHAHWTMEEGAIESAVDHIYAGARLIQADRDESIQLWQIVLVGTHLSKFSDPAVRGVIAHEFGHVASALPSDPFVRATAIAEDRAEAIAQWWGFTEELAAVKRETERG